MTETEFIALAERTLQRLESAVEDVDDDIDLSRQGNVLTIEFDDGFQIVINVQVPTRQIWLASFKGGHHYSFDGKSWVEGSGERIEVTLAALLTKKLGRAVEAAELS